MIDVDEWRQVVGVDATAGDRERRASDKHPRADDDLLRDRIAHCDVDPFATTDVAHGREAVGQDRLRVSKRANRRFG